MAEYHLSVKTHSRAAGRSATASAAYRAGTRIVDERTGEIHDYRRKGGVLSSVIVLPEGAPEWARDSSQLWNRVEQAETRKNSTVAREFEIGLPHELSPSERDRLALALTRELVDKYGFAAEASFHAPNAEGDDRNFHCHILVSTRRLEPNGFTTKTREWDTSHWGGGDLVEQWRARYATLQNQALEAAGSTARVDHRSHADRGIETAPSVHLGPSAVGYERRTGKDSRNRIEARELAEERERYYRELDAMKAQQAETDEAIRIISDELAEAQRVSRLSVDELAAAIKAKTPADIDVQVERDRQVVRASRRVERLKNKQVNMGERIEAWREAHPLRVVTGVRIGPLVRMQRWLDRLTDLIPKAQRRLETIRNEAGARLWPSYSAASTATDEMVELRKERLTEARKAASEQKMSNSMAPKPRKPSGPTM